jgi:hypothetical protein
MGRLYTVTFDNVSVGTAAQDLFELSPADDKPIRIHGLVLSNVGGTADAGDAQEELVRINILRGFTTSGSGGTAPTPVPLNPNDTAAGFAAEVNNTTVANTGTSTTPFSDGWNVRIPYQMFFTPETQIQASQANTTIVVRSSSTLADAISVSGTLFVEEL